MEAEVKGYLTELNILRGQMSEAIKGLNNEAANWKPLPKDTNSIYIILYHLIGAETFETHPVLTGEMNKL